MYRISPLFGILLFIVFLSFSGCIIDDGSENCSELDVLDIHIVQDLIPNCTDIANNRMKLSVYVDGREIQNLEWEIDGQTFRTDSLEIEGTGIKRGVVTVGFDGCVVERPFQASLTVDQLETSISGFCWRDSRYFEAGTVHLYDNTDIDSGPIVVELLDGETLELIARDTTDEDSAYSFTDLNEGLYVLKFNKRETLNSFIWLKQNPGPYQISIIDLSLIHI